MRNVSAPPITIESLQAELDVISRRAFQAEASLDTVKNLWSQWKFIDKEDEGGCAHVFFPKEVMTRLLQILGA